MTDPVAEAVERLTLLDDAYELSEVYKDTPAGQMDQLCDDLCLVLSALSTAIAEREAMREVLDLFARACGAAASNSMR